MKQFFQIRFITKEFKYLINSNSYEITKLTTVIELNKLVNSVLKSTNPKHEDVEFNFLTNGYLLKDKFDEHLETIFEEQDEEKVIQIEYIKKIKTPEPFKSLCNNDWVGCVHSNSKFIISGCYDGFINIWSIEKNKNLLSFSGHKNAVKDIMFIDKEFIKDYFDISEEDVYFVSTSNEEISKIWKWKSIENKISQISTCKGHTRSVDCVDVYNDVFATGSSDNLLKIWYVSEKKLLKDSIEEAPFKKGRTNEPIVKYPYTTLIGHTEAITDLCWLRNKNDNSNVLPDLATCSMDNTIKIWDTTSFDLKQTLVGPKAFLTLDYSPKLKLIISGLCDNHLRLFDLRQKDDNAVKAAFSSHSGWVTSVSWQGEGEYMFISGSFDTKVKQWDVRSTKAPLFDLLGHDDHVLAVDWSNSKYMVSGSTDNYIKIFKFIN